jgi:dTMP kinase
VTFLLDLDRKTSLARIHAGKRSLDRIERESEEFFDAVRAGYLKLALENPDRIVLVDASRPADLIAREIQSAILQRNPLLFS